MTTLLAVTGLSPAILTETVWALAKGKPRLLPERVVVVTTATGAAVLEEQLFTPRPDWGGRSVWETLRRALKAKPHELIADPPHVIALPDPARGRALPLDDIRTPAGNAAAAEFIFSRVWDIVRDPAQTLVASIAGGRKTMGALLHSAVSLIGREQDRVTHVLVDSPYDRLPGFFFPAQPACPLVDRLTGRAHLAADARLALADVPFVSLRNRFQELDDLPSSFLKLRDKLADALARDAEREIPIRIEHNRQRLAVDGVAHKCRPRPLAVLEFILRCHDKKQTFSGNAKSPYELASEAFVKWHAKHRERLTGFATGGFTARELTKDLNHLRTLLKDAAWKPASKSFVQSPFRLEVA